MGYSTWSDSDYTAYAANTSYRTLSRAEVFKSRGMVDSLDPAKFVIRESRDSAQNPKSTPVIFGLDVTGSMGAYCEAIAKTQLPDLMTDIHNRKVVTDPHIMFMGIGDVDAYDRAPVQVSQFKCDWIHTLCMGIEVKVHFARHEIAVIRHVAVIVLRRLTHLDH
jgi:hypothetical protein